MKVKNTAAFVVTIGGTQVIAPLATAEVYGENRGIQTLLSRGVLVPTDDAGDAGDGGDENGAPQTVADLKQALDAAGIEYPKHASKAELQALYGQARGQ
ncbi:HeH/LEM domain-containing protein [Cupriavidus sp. amp6]|uniref:HeH/LEM domain-containing protein n=1 Tax=Cupriavidus sp. amp6 TaxID=388051 RepID=UPI000409CC25|nr:HeH/LEM domain-containing protein [Cupriavidus sp. amp6]